MTKTYAENKKERERGVVTTKRGRFPSCLLDVISWNIRLSGLKCRELSRVNYVTGLVFASM